MDGAGVLGGPWRRATGAKRLNRRSRDGPMIHHLDFLGWSALDVGLGTLSSRGCDMAPVNLDWQPGDIRNCSYAPHQGWIGITAEDRSRGGQVLAVHDRITEKSRILVRAPVVLHHAFNRAGTAICYTQPQPEIAGAALYVCDVLGGGSRRLGVAAAAHDRTPAWFPDDTHIAYVAPTGLIEVLDLASECSEALTEGAACAVHPDGSRLAVRRRDRLLLFKLADHTTEPLPIRRRCLEHGLTDGLSWAPQGRYLSFGLLAGLVGKATVFRLLDLSTRRQTRIDVRYLRGLVLI
jgi:hypothetical protein